MRDAMRLSNLLKDKAQLASVDVQDGPMPGVVTAFDPATQTAKVRLMPRDVETGWIPVRTAMAGNGWGIFSPPTVGSFVDVHFTDGSLDDPYISGRSHGDVDKPLAVPSGEIWLAHASGQTIKLCNNGTVIIGGKSAAGTIFIGNSADLHKLMKDTAMAVYNSHTHTAPGGATSVPNQLMTEADHLTIETKAS